MSYSTINPLPIAKLMVIGLDGSDTIFRSRVYTLLNLDPKNPQHYQLWNEIMNEVCYQVCDCIVQDYRGFLELLHHVPHTRDIPYIHTLEPQLIQEFSDAVKQFGVHVGFSMKPHWHLNFSNDILYHKYQEGMIALTLFPKAHIYDH